MSEGGTFCRFTVGRPGNSVRHLRYIARPEAAREGAPGALLRNLPDAIAREPGETTLLPRLLRYARVLEQEELARHRSRGAARTHYQAILSFERDIGSARARELIAAWLEAAFPRAPAVAFLHRDTAHLHAQVWIAARQTDGKKINLDARRFRQLDEVWNRLYSRALGRDEQEHLEKKWQTEGYKRRWREGERLQKPGRAAQQWHPAQFTERERQRLGAGYERDETRTQTDQPQAPGGYPQPARAESGTPGREPSPDHAAFAVRRAVAASERALSEARRLCEEAARLAGREREIDRER
jgi:hypothetical protein